MSKEEKYKLRKKGDLWVTKVLDNEYAFRKWTWGEKNIISGQATKLDPITGLVTYDSAFFNLHLVQKTVLKKVGDKFVAFTEEEVRNLDGQLGERLFQITQSLNLVRNIEAQNL